MRNKLIGLTFLAGLLLSGIFGGCEADDPQDGSEYIFIDSIVATKTDVIVWEEVFITAYAKGENLTYSWYTNHGTMFGKDSVTARYWGCPSCTGNNIVECTVSNEFGSVSDTIRILVRPDY